MKWIYAVLLVLSPGILYVFALLAIAMKEKYFPCKCPECKDGKLKWINGILESYPIRKGTGDFYICPDCKERFFWSDDLKIFQKVSDPKYDHWYEKKNEKTAR